VFCGNPKDSIQTYKQILEIPTIFPRANHLKFNSSLLKSYLPKREVVVFQPSFFEG